MKFLRIPRNSLFGWLLRSQWWISIVLAFAIIGLLAALIPTEYIFFAFVSALPLFLIGLIVAWRQISLPSNERRQAALEHAADLSWREFSKLFYENLRSHGFYTESYEQSGADFKISHEGSYILVHTLRWKSAVHGLEPMRKLAQAMHNEEAQRGLYIAAGGHLSPPALRFARENNIQIWGNDELSLFLLGKKPFLAQ